MTVHLVSAQRFDFHFAPAIRPGRGAEARLGVALRRGGTFVTPILWVNERVILGGGHFGVDAVKVFETLKTDLAGQLSSQRFDPSGKLDFSAYFYLSVGRDDPDARPTHLPVRVTNPLPIEVRLLPECCLVRETLPPPAPVPEAMPAQ